MDNEKKLTINDIAAQLGLSVATVSRAINDSEDIAPETRRKVRELAEAVGYTSRRSTSLKGKLAILCGRGFKEDDCDHAIAKAFRTTAVQSRFAVETFSIDNDFDIDSFFAEHKLSGALVLGVDYNSLLFLKLKVSNQPIVMMNSQIADNPVISSVRSNDLLAVSEAIDYLVSRGHQRIAFIGNEKEPLLNAERFAGYFFGLQKNAIPYLYDLTFFAAPTIQGGETAADYFLMYNKFITAAICASENIALGFINSMRKAGRQIPKDLSVVGFCDTFASQERTFDFTAIIRDCESMGQQAFHALKAIMRGFPTVQLAIPCSLIEKDKTCSSKAGSISSDV